MMMLTVLVELLLPALRALRQGEVLGPGLQVQTGPALVHARRVVLVPRAAEASEKLVQHGVCIVGNPCQTRNFFL